MSTRDRVTPSALGHWCYVELSLLQNIMTGKQQHLDRDAQNMAIAVCMASACSRRGPLQDWQCRTDELGCVAPRLMSNPLISSWEQTWEVPLAEESCFCVLALFSVWLCLGRVCLFV